MAQLVKLEEKIPTKPKVNDDDFDKILIKVYENYNIYFNNPVLHNCNYLFIPFISFIFSKF